MFARIYYYTRWLSQAGTVLCGSCITCWLSSEVIFSGFWEAALTRLLFWRLLATSRYRSWRLWIETVLSVFIRLKALFILDKIRDDEITFLGSVWQKDSYKWQFHLIFMWFLFYFCLHLIFLNSIWNSTHFSFYWEAETRKPTNRRWIAIYVQPYV